MSKFDDEYYIFDANGGDDYPLLAFNCSSKDRKHFHYPEPIKEGEIELPIQVEFSKITSYPKNPKFVEGLSLGSKIVVNEKIYSLLEPLTIHGIQLFPIDILTPKKKTVTGYHLLFIWNELAAVDKNNYQGSEVDEDGYISSLEKFSLDENLLSEIPVEKRLIFALAESMSTKLIHQSVYDLIMQANPTGFFFQKVKDWDIGSYFD